MKKIASTLIFSFFFLHTLIFASGQARGPQDIVLILDKAGLTSGTKEFIAGEFIKEHLKLGDTFHLIGFSGTNYPLKLEFYRKAMGNSDIDAIKNAVFALITVDIAPSGQEKVRILASAIGFAEQYINSLSPPRQKKTVLLTNGDAQSIISPAKARFSAKNASLEWIKIPEKPRSTAIPPSKTPEPPKPVEKPLIEPVKKQETTVKPSGKTEKTDGKKEEKPLIEPEKKSETTVKPSEKSEKIDKTEKNEEEKPLITPEKAKKEEKKPKVVIPQQPEPSVKSVAPPQSPKIIMPDEKSSPPMRVRSRPVFRLPRLSTEIAALLIAVLFFMVGIVLMVCAHIFRSLEFAFSLIGEQDADEGAVFLSLFVEDQNTGIGRRNMHVVSAGNSLSIGGGDSDFLIFLVPFPQNIAFIHFDGEQCFFIPKKQAFFPDVNTKAMPDCVGKTIKVLSEKNYELFIRVVQYESPYKKLAELAHSIKLPGEISI